MQWFRMYAEFITDPIVRMLSFEDQRHFVAALCLKSSGVLDKTYPSDEIRRAVLAQMIGLNADDGVGKNSLDAANARLRKFGLVDENWHPTNWDKRQFRSDHEDRTAAERMRRYRSKRNVTDVTNVVTALDTDTDTDTDTEQKKSKTRAKARSANVACEFPEGFVLDEPMRQQALARAPDCDVDQAFLSFKANHLSRGSKFKNWRQAWTSWLGNFSQYGYPKRQNGSANSLATKYPGYQF